jgi:hypothetical protein
MTSPLLPQRTVKAQSPIQPLTPPPTKHKHSANPRSSPNNKSEKRRKMMDEDNNPFLSKPGSFHLPTPTVDETRDTVTYVFRGSKKIFANPFLGMAGRFPPSELDVEHDEFEAHPCPKPRLLWPSKPVNKPSTPERRSSVQKRRANERAVSDTETEGDVSPPSTPLVAALTTPRNGARSRRFGAGGLGGNTLESGDEIIGPADVFSDSEGEYLVDHTEGEEEEEEMPVRRGLLFGAASGMKRGLEGAAAAVNGGKKAKHGMRI